MNSMLKTALAATCLASGGAALAARLIVRAPELPIGSTWSVIEITQDAKAIALESWERKTYWDLRPQAGTGRNEATRRGVNDERARRTWLFLAVMYELEPARVCSIWLFIGSQK